MNSSCSLYCGRRSEVVKKRGERAGGREKWVITPLSGTSGLTEEEGGPRWRFTGPPP